jgi:hypothetical protein
MNYTKNGRYLLTLRGVQFVATYNGMLFISDIDGTKCNINNPDITSATPLTGIRAARVGDIIVDTDGDKAKILEIGNSHTAFLRSVWDAYDAAGDWLTFKEAEEEGWKLQTDETVETVETVEFEGKKYDKAKVAERLAELEEL